MLPVDKRGKPTDKFSIFLAKTLAFGNLNFSSLKKRKFLSLLAH